MSVVPLDMTMTPEPPAAAGLVDAEASALDVEPIGREVDPDADVAVLQKRNSLVERSVPEPAGSQSRCRRQFQVVDAGVLILEREEGSGWRRCCV